MTFLEDKLERTLEATPKRTERLRNLSVRNGWNGYGRLVKQSPFLD
jgi:hypothetical protein